MIGVPDEKWGELVTALVVTSPGSTLTEDDVIACTKHQARRLQVPEDGRVPRPNSARTATGKLQKFKLRAPFWEGRDRQVN